MAADCWQRAVASNLSVSIGSAAAAAAAGKEWGGGVLLLLHGGRK